MDFLLGLCPWVCAQSKCDTDSNHVSNYPCLAPSNSCLIKKKKKKGKPLFTNEYLVLKNIKFVSRPQSHRYMWYKYKYYVCYFIKEEHVVQKQTFRSFKNFKKKKLFFNTNGSQQVS